MEGRRLDRDAKSDEGGHKEEVGNVSIQSLAKSMPAGQRSWKEGLMERVERPGYSARMAVIHTVPSKNTPNSPWASRTFLSSPLEEDRARGIDIVGWEGSGRC